MMRRISLGLALALHAATAFRVPMTMKAVPGFAYGLPGVSAPFSEGFDPANFSGDSDEATVKKFQEAELKHGRLAMLAALGILVQESFHPLFGGTISGPAIFEFQQVENIDPPFWVILATLIGFVEGRTITNSWETIRETQAAGRDVANLKEGATPGDIGFDPLGLCPADEEGFAEMRTKELNHCRLAMIGVAGMVAQELVLGPNANHGIFASF